MAFRDDDSAERIHSVVYLVVRDEIVVVGNAGELLLCDGEAFLYARFRVGSTPAQAAFQFGEGRRLDEDENGVRGEAANLLRALHLDLQNYVLPARSQLLNFIAWCAVEVLAVAGVL